MDTLDSPLEAERDGCGIGRTYAYGAGGTGGFGFGPGAEEDEMMEDQATSPQSQLPGIHYSCNQADPLVEDYPTPYPSLTPHPNPNHFSNHVPYTNTSALNTSRSPFQTDAPLAFAIRPKSPLSAQTFSTALPAPRSAGLLQPALNGPLGPDATPIERARAAHGPQCKSIPKLTVSPYPDPGTGKQTMYSLCPDCGAIENV